MEVSFEDIKKSQDAIDSANEKIRELEAENEDLLIQLAAVAVYDDHRSVPGDDISAELAVECASLKAEVERLTRREQHLLGVGDALTASVKWRGERMDQYAGENDRLTKRIEELEEQLGRIPKTIVSMD